MITAALLMTSILQVVSGQTGGTYDLSHSVIAGGGSRSTGGTFTLNGTIGQSSAGAVSAGGGYALRSGFWASDALAPTAASASISGQIKNANGRGIRNVRLTLTNAETGETVRAISSSFGYYSFDGVRVGQTYILTVFAKRFSFNPNTRVIALLDNSSDEDFIALPL